MLIIYVPKTMYCPNFWGKGASNYYNIFGKTIVITILKQRIKSSTLTNTTKENICLKIMHVNVYLIYVF